MSNSDEDAGCCGCIILVALLAALVWGGCKLYETNREVHELRMELRK